ncbi:nuclear transport factor 2 family protein [Kibdelosporangium philippinense]|uniref:Nuclear transport factor 2 family protein n=1 Tax=Kibdelosporangium philippinense TaxID=211113 RepID=A0ABS8Z7S7_9PSEU|nr:nuclear transport factor 2 family protein [Kibdelosporangium philippinense]MCE7001887.1 nuclear transport factor 2 family protein [Kibdelosporangium philippinense]
MDLIALEEIRRLKHRYLRSVDQKSWDELESSLTEDAVADYGTRTMGKPLVLTGRAEIMQFMRDNLGGEEILTFHFCGQPEIDIDGDEANGTWAFEDTVIIKESRLVIKGAAYYVEQYVRSPEHGWRIKHITYNRVYEVMMSMDDLPSLKFLAGGTS